MLLICTFSVSPNFSLTFLFIHFLKFKDDKTDSVKNLRFSTDFDNVLKYLLVLEFNVWPTAATKQKHNGSMRQITEETVFGDSHPISLTLSKHISHDRVKKKKNTPVFKVLLHKCIYLIEAKSYLF